MQIKKSYPNIGGKAITKTEKDISKWIDVAKKISEYSRVYSESDLIDFFIKDWKHDERDMFRKWLKYYQDGNTEKYDVKTKKAEFLKRAFGNIPSNWSVNRQNTDDMGVSLTSLREQREKTQKEKDLDAAKKYKEQMRGRLRSFRKLLEKYHDLLPKQNLDELYDELHDLEKNIGRLNVYASLEDCTIRSINRLKVMGMDEFASILKTADDQKKPDSAVPSQARTVVDAISRLESLSKSIKHRAFVRELASIDMILDNLGLSYYFTEVTDAQAKLIEAYGYSSNKLDSLVAKLRGGKKEDKAQEKKTHTDILTPKIEAPAIGSPEVKQIDIGSDKIESDSLLSKPVSPPKPTLPPPVAPQQPVKR